MGRHSRHVRFSAFAVTSLLAAAVCVAGCSSDHIHEYRAHSDRVTAGAGDAMASNRAVHTVDPWPYYSQKTQIDMDGKRAQVAVRRYQSNTSNKPQSLSSGSSPTNSSSNGAEKN